MIRKSFRLLPLIFSSCTLSVSNANSETANPVLAIEKLNSFLNQKREITAKIRIQGHAKMVNRAGREIELYVAGSTHDGDSLDEGNYISQGFKKNGQSLKCELQLEQGSKKSVLTQIGQIFSQYQSSGKIKLSDPEKSVLQMANALNASSASDEGSEFSIVEKDFEKRNQPIRNTDLDYNSASLDYLFEKFGPQRVYSTVVSEVRAFVSLGQRGANWKVQFSRHAMQLVVDQILQSTAHADYFKKNPITNDADWNNEINFMRKFSEDDRDDYFAQQIFNSPGPTVCFAANSMHVLGALKKLKDKIRSIEITDLTAGRGFQRDLLSSERACDQGWSQLPFPSSFSCHRSVRAVQEAEHQ